MRVTAANDEKGGEYKFVSVYIYGTCGVVVSGPVFDKNESGLSMGSQFIRHPPDMLPAGFPLLQLRQVPEAQSTLVLPNGEESERKFWKIIGVSQPSEEPIHNKGVSDIRR